MILKPVNLLGAAVYTRALEPGKDYDWYVKTGDIQLFPKIAEIQRLALRNISGDIPKLAVLIEPQRVGLLIGEMPSQRIDHSKRIIYDTFYLEFDHHYQRTVLHAAAVLLLSSPHQYQTLEHHFVDYAERLFYNATATSELILTTVSLPIINQKPDFNLSLITQKKLALFSNQVNRNRCARYLINFEARHHSSFALISTGRLNLDKCYQIARQSNECLLLTLSAEISTEVNLSKRRFSVALKQMINFTKSKRLSLQEASK